MMIEINSTIGNIDISNTITSSAGENLTVGQTTIITYSGVSPKIMAEGTEKSEIKFWMNDEQLDRARTCSRVRGAYLDSTYTFTPAESGTYEFKILGGYLGDSIDTLEVVASLIIAVSGAE